MDQTLIETKKICKIYKSNGNVTEALKNIDIQINKGEVFALLGVNGAGKTTLSSILATQLNPTFGDVLYNGKSIYNDIPGFRKRLGFCPQAQNLDLDLNVKNNLLFSGRYYGLSKEMIEARLEFLLDRFDLKKYAESDLNTLSGGYRQRFLLARTLMHDPELIIMDEPTVGLDPQLRRSLWNFILQLKEQQKTIILTTHYLDEADILSDRICLIHMGQVKTIGTPKELKNSWKSSNLEDVFINIINERP